jgi:hypothetical protein
VGPPWFDDGTKRDRLVSTSRPWKALDCSLVCSLIPGGGEARRVFGPEDPRRGAEAVELRADDDVLGDVEPLRLARPSELASAPPASASEAIFAGLTMFDLQRLRRTEDIHAAPLLAASIFPDVLNVFLLFLSLFGRGE